MDPPEPIRVNVTIVYIDPETGRPTDEVEYCPAEKDETKP
jgi:hypothetical protein